MGKKNPVWAILSLALMLSLATGAAAIQPTPEAVFPIEYEAFGKSFAFTGYFIEIGEFYNSATGKDIMTLIILGSDYSEASLRGEEGDWITPVYCDIITHDETIRGELFQSGPTYSRFLFYTDAMPETVILTNGETGEVILSFDVADVPQKE